MYMMTGTTSTILYDHMDGMTVTEQVERLSELAVELRDGSQREEAGRTDLPEVLVKLLQRSISDVRERARIHEQAGRVVANLVAENDDNRDRVIATGYIPAALAYVELSLSGNEGGVGDGQAEAALQSARKALVASLLNMVIQGHEPSIEALADPSSIDSLLRISTGLFLRLVSPATNVREDVDEALLESYDLVLGWVWTVLSAAVTDSKSDTPLNLRSDTLQSLFIPLLTPTNLASVALDSEVDRFCSAAECLFGLITRSSAAAAPAIRAQPSESLKVWTEPFLSSIDTHFSRSAAYTAHDSSTPLAALLVLIEHADGGEDEDHAKAKASLTHALVELGSVLPLVPASNESEIDQRSQGLRAAFDTLLGWTVPVQRDDMRMSALLTIGNGIMSDSTCRALFEVEAGAASSVQGGGASAGEELARHAVQALQGTAQVQHAAMGFLRNLSVPASNKIRLGRADLGLWDALMRAGVWKEGKDVVGSVQGGAVGLVKNLCRDTLPNVQTFLSHPEATDDLLALAKRTDDPAIRFEIARVYVNCIRAVYAARPPAAAVTIVVSADSPTSAPPPTRSEALTILSSEGVIGIIASMLAQSAQYPILANESIIALALLVTFASDEAVRAIATALAEEKVLVVFDSILCPSAEAPSSKETRANAVTLLRANDLSAVREAVVKRLGTAEEHEGEAREVSDEGKALLAL